MFVDFNILNQLGSPSINSNTFANRPAAGQTGRLFVSTDTFEIYRDNGTGWDLIGGPGAGTITGTGTATQVAYFTGSQTIGSSANLFWDATNSRLGIATATPGSRLDVHAPGTVGQFIAEFNATNAIGNTYLQFKYQGTNTWRIGNTYNAGLNFYSLHNSALNLSAVSFLAATNIAAFTAQQTYASGQAQSGLFTYNLTVPNGTNFSSPNVIGAVNSFLNLSLGGNTTVPASTRQGLEGNSRISFTGAGTLTVDQGSTVRAFSAISSVYSFNGSAVGTVTHLAGFRICFPDNIGSAINITNNYGLLLNDQTAGLGTVTYTNRWGIYQEGASDLNYFNGNLLLGSTTNSGQRLQVTGTALFTGSVTGTGNSSTYTVTAASGVARSKSITSTLVAAANNDVLVGLDINSTFTNGAFTGVSNLAARFQNADISINGFNFGKGNGSGTNNIAIGTRFGTLNTSNNNTGVGAAALAVDIGGNNAACGYAALLRNTTGTQNVGMGSVALQFSTTGSNNTALGYNAGAINTTGSQNIFIGNWTTGIVATNSNWTFIGNSTTTSSFIAGNLLLNTQTDAGFRFDCNGTARVNGNANSVISTILNSAATNNVTTLIRQTAAGGASDAKPIGLQIDIQGATDNDNIIYGRYWNSGTPTESFYVSRNGNMFLSGRVGVNVSLTAGVYSSLMNINASAQFQIDSTTRGFLPPRMTGAQAEAIATPAAGLMVYANNGNGVTITSTGWWGYDGATWVKLN